MFYLAEEESNNSVVLLAMTVVLMLIIISLFFISTFSLFELFWVKHVSPKPFFKHFYIRKKKLTPDQIFILQSQFSFYQNLSYKEKKYFEHRVASFIQHHTFEGKQGVYIDDQKKVLISAIAIMLTFGYRTYLLSSLNHFLVYPKAFYSTTNKAYHKGEFNPSFKAIILSWEDFMTGYNIDNDNFNLGIHEIVHALHFDFLRPKNDSISAYIFTRHYKKLKQFLRENPAYRERLVASKYLRNYAFTNHFEFIAVLIESFFETPHELKTRFPEMYSFIAKMLNCKSPKF